MPGPTILSAATFTTLRVYLLCHSGPTNDDVRLGFSCELGRLLGKGLPQERNRFRRFPGKICSPGFDADSLVVANLSQVFKERSIAVLSPVDLIAISHQESWGLILMEDFDQLLC